MIKSVPKEIDINEWERFGDGYTADSYYHKTDSSLVLKLYADFIHPDEGFRELSISEAVYKLGIPVPRVYDYVKCGNRYGVTFERIPGKCSFARGVFNFPEKMEEYAFIFADLAKQLHTTKCDTDFFPDMAEHRRRLVADSVYLTGSQKRIAFDAIDSLPKSDTCVHGDFHIGNVIIGDDNKAFFIDLPDFAYGSPFFDLGTMMMMARYIPDGMCKSLFHIDQNTYSSFWIYFIKYYFNGEALESVEHKIKPFAGLQAVHFAEKFGRLDEDLQNIIRYTLGE